MPVDLETRVKRTALRIYKRMGEEKPALFSGDSWAGKAMELCLVSAAFRSAFFRFLDVFPHLKEPSSFSRHVQEYFSPREVRAEAEALGVVMAEPESTAALDTASVLAVRLSQLVGIFAAGSTFEEAAPALSSLRVRGAAASGGLLGENAISKREANEALERVQQFLDFLAGLAETWSPLGSGTLNLDWGYTPKVNISLKVSSLCSSLRPVAFEYSVESAKERLRMIYRKAMKVGAHVVLDMERREWKSLTLAAYKGLNLEPEFLDYPHTGIAVQSSLKESERDLEDLLLWARSHRQRFMVRLVKSAYREVEEALSARSGWPAPVYTEKAQTDLAFERLARRLIENHPFLDFVCASHNVRSIAWVLENARELKVPPDRLEFQVLYGMADPLLKALLEEGLRVRVYAAVGEPARGAGYLLRRLMEITAKDSFLRRAFYTGGIGPDPGELLRAPRVSAPVAPSPAAAPGTFRNEPRRDWTLAESRERLAQALAAVREKMPYRLAMVVGEKEIPSVSATRRKAEASHELLSVNPNLPEEVIGFCPCGGRKEVRLGVEAAALAFDGWRGVEASTRAEVLLRAAAAAREQRDELAALVVLEAGASWEEADADVCSAIDYLEYYARLMVRIGQGVELGILGEPSRLEYGPRGVAGVITSWSPALALPVSRIAAALVSGNTVVYKPSSRTPVLGFQIYRLFQKAGLPAGALNLIPGPGAQIGEHLAAHPGVALTVFAGSREVGLKILERSCRQPQAGERRHVVADLGGKNAAIVDSDADLDEAVVQLTGSAFGYQGQKASACSRLFIVEDVYARFLDRLKAAAESLELGPVEDPNNEVGAVIDHTAQERIQHYIDAGKREGKTLLLRKPPEGPGFTVPLAIFYDVRLNARIATEEIFGPVLCVHRAKSFEQALELVNSGPNAIAGAVFSRSPAHLHLAGREYRVDALFLNRGTAEAAVGRQPFGMHAAGGPDSLLPYLSPHSQTENALRRGFSPS